jgi:hypothetical protein
MQTKSKAGALLLGAALAAGVAGCKKHNEDVTPAPVTAPNTAVPAQPPATTEPAPVVPPASPPAPDTTPPSGGTAPGTSGTSGTQGSTGAGRPPSTAPDRIDQPDTRRDRRPTY